MQNNIKNTVETYYVYEVLFIKVLFYYYYSLYKGINYTSPITSETKL